MTQITTNIKSIRDIMRKDAGVDGDAQRISQMVWMLFLKIFADKEEEWELTLDNYESPIPERLKWSTWASDDEGLTGDELMEFINNDLFPTLKDLNVQSPQAKIIRSVFEDTYNYMKNGTLFRQVINIINKIDFNSSSERHVFNDLYETILKELQSAGSSGEYYTPRAVTQFMVDMVNPQLGETILDMASGTGGFLTCSIEHLRKQVNTPKERDILQKSIRGVEKKPLPHLLCTTNLMLHGFDLPAVRRDNMLTMPYSDWGKKDRVDIILMNPPFGGTEEDGTENNFPKKFRTKETADLFLALIIKLLKTGGRCAVVLPDGTLFGEGVKTRLKEELLTKCNLHTIIRLPKGVFSPYTNIKTNVIFFEKGTPTKDVWYFEHPYPVGIKNYNKSRPISINEFDLEKAWWKNRRDDRFTKYAWKISVEEIKNRQYNLDFKNPYQKINSLISPEKLLFKYQKTAQKVSSVQDEIINVLTTALEQNTTGNTVKGWTFLQEHFKTFFTEKNAVKKLRETILQLAAQGKITTGWRRENLGIEPASELLKHIKSDKEKLVKEKKTRREKPFPTITKEEIPYELPESWVWCRLTDICVYIQRGKSPKYSETRKYPVIAQKCVQWKGLEMFKAKFIDPETIGKYATERILKTNDLLWNSTGRGSLGRIGKFNEKLNEYELAVADSHVTVIRVDKNNCSADYVFKYLSSPFIQDNIEDRSSGSTNQIELSTKTVKETIIPLPPFEEQKALASQVNDLMDLCDSLEREIEQNTIQLEQLTESCLRQIFVSPQQKEDIIQELLPDIDKYAQVAMATLKIENELKCNYGKVEKQKTGFLLQAVKKQPIPYTFEKQHFGTFSWELSNDLDTNPYLRKTKAGQGEVYEVKASKHQEVLGLLNAPQNASFVQALDELIQVYQMPLINAKTDQIELLNTVCKSILDTQSTDLDNIYGYMKFWTIKQEGFNTKAEKFSRPETEKMLRLVLKLGWEKELIKSS